MSEKKRTAHAKAIAKAGGWYSGDMPPRVSDALDALDSVARNLGANDDCCEKVYSWANEAGAYGFLTALATATMKFTPHGAEVSHDHLLCGGDGWDRFPLDARKVAWSKISTDTVRAVFSSDRPDIAAAATIAGLKRVIADVEQWIRLNPLREPG